MNIFILGCGRVGARLAGVLAAEHSVTIMDWSAAAFDRLPEDFSGRTVTANGIDLDALKNAGVPRADAFIAVTNGDNRNLMAGQIAQALGVQKAIVRVYDPVRCEIFGRTGLTTISPTVTGAEALFDMVTSSERRT